MKKVLLLIGVVFLCLAILLSWMIVTNHKFVTSGTGAYILCSCFYTIFAASLGWWVTLHNSTKSNTVSLISAMRLNSEYLSRVSDLYEVYPNLEVIKKEDLKSNEQGIIKAINASKFILNYYEFLCIAIKSGDVDENICKSFLENIFKGMYIKSKDMIEVYRHKESSLLAENFTYYAKKWNPILNKQI